MIPDYLTFIRFQDKRNIVLFYIVTLVLLGFYLLNVGATFSIRDAGLIGGICALMFYNLIYDLKAYWAYKCVIKNIDFSYFKDKRNRQYEMLLTHPAAAGVLSFIVFSLLTLILISCAAPIYATVILFLVVPLMTYVLFFFVRNSYVKQVQISAVESVRYKNLAQYLLFTVPLSLFLNLLTISPLRNSAKFGLSGDYLSLSSIIAMCILCAIVLAVNLIFLCFTKRYVFLGRLFLNEINLFFSPSRPSGTLLALPFWQRMILLLVIEFFWVALLGLFRELAGITLWFEVWFLCCYAPCLVYYCYHTWQRWHDDFMMSCDMYLRWDEIKKKLEL